MKHPIGRRMALLAGAAVAGLLPLAFSFHGAGAAPPPTATFNKNLLLPGSSGAAEPSIRTNSAGQSFVIGPTGSGCPAMRVSHNGSSAKFIGTPDHTLGGGDCDWAIGPKETAVLPGFGTPTSDDLAYSSLDNLLNLTVGKSNDAGNTFGPPNPLAAQVAGDDRQWMAADPQLNSAGFATIYLTYHDISLGNIELSVSVDGGQTYTQNSGVLDLGMLGQWAGALAGNELGNIVARRAGGTLTLYSIFQTPDSAVDNAAQAAAQTANFNRVYEAIGTVTGPDLHPVVTWKNYEIWHGPLGARYNRIFPVTAVDGAGRVYAYWSNDGVSISTKSDATGSGWNPAGAPTTLPQPAGVNTAIMPWAQAGKSNLVDVVFYGANGGTGLGHNPQDDPNNQWNAYFSQTIDGGASYTTSTASDHIIHRGPLCIDGLNCNLIGNRDRTLLDFFQVSIDPTNGAADIAYADDSASPHSSVMFFTRQCTGISATTGAALTNDCVAPPPPPTPPQGTTCPGPQVADFVGDAPNNYPAGDGSNMDNLDVVNAYFGTPDASNLKVVLTINNLQAPPPPANMISAYWTVYWTFGGTTYFAQATSNGTGMLAVWTFDVGTYDGSFHHTNTVSGTAITGKNGTLTWIVPRADVGNPANGASLTNPFADTHGSFTVQGTGVYYTRAADRAPDSGFGAPYVVGQTCQPNPPPPNCHEGDGEGDTNDQHGHTGHVKADADQCEEGNQDGVNFQDNGDAAGNGKHDFKSTSVLSITFNDTYHQLIMTGRGLDNLMPTDFTITMVDNGTVLLDTFSIALGNGYVNAGHLTNGLIQLN